jgi:hypothetical protein
MISYNYDEQEDTYIPYHVIPVSNRNKKIWAVLKNCSYAILSDSKLEHCKMQHKEIPCSQIKR